MFKLKQVWLAHVHSACSPGMNYMIKGKTDKAITSGILGLFALAFAANDLLEASGSSLKDLGIVIGLGGGFISVVLDEINRVFGLKRLPIRLLSMCFSPLGLFILLPFSLQLGRGYFVGAGMTFCMCTSIQALCEMQALNGKQPSTSLSSDDQRAHQD